MLTSRYKPCNCSQRHLTKEHLYTQVSISKDGRPTFTMSNPYYLDLKVERRGRPRKTNESVTSTTSDRKVPAIKISSWKPSIGQSSYKTRVIRKPFQTKINKSCNELLEPLTPNSSSSSSTSTSSLSPVKSKYDVWHSIKNTFHEYRKICGNNINNNKNITINHSTVKNNFHKPTGDTNHKSISYSTREKQKKHISPLERAPFRLPPGTINGVTVFTMKNPFASKCKVNSPIDELTRLYFSIIDTLKDNNEQYLDSDSSIDPFNSSSVLPLTPVSPISPMSTTSSPTMENHATNESLDDNETENEGEVKIDEFVFKEFDYNEKSNYNSNMTSGFAPITSTIFDDDICIKDFDEFEFEKMISDLPNIEID